MIESVAGFMSAAPDPWSTRAAMSISPELARPQRSDGHDSVVEHDHEQAERDRSEREPLAVLLCEDPSPHADVLPSSVNSAAETSPGGFIWVPTPRQLETANVTRLATSLGCDDFSELHRVSI